MTDQLAQAQEALSKSIATLDTQPVEVKPKDITYKLTPKYKRWEELFFDKKNKVTYYNATRSALEAYNLDEKTQYWTAATIGKENYQKHQNLAKRYYESHGKTEGTLYDIFWSMMLARKDVNMLYSIAEAMDVKLPEYKLTANPTYIMNQTNTQINTEGGDYAGLTDEQLTNVIKSKVHKLRSAGVITGTGETGQGEPTQIHETTPETIRGEVLE